MTVRTIAVAALICACIPAVNAQALWSAPALTGTVRVEDDGVLKTRAFDGIHGTGLRLRTSLYRGTAHVYLPVTAAVGSTFKFIQLRAEDRTAAGAVKAELFAQPVGAGKLPVLIAAISTGKLAAPGMQVKECGFRTSHTLSADSQYYIRLTLTTDSPLGVAVYGASLSGVSRCTPGGPFQCGPCPEPDPF